MMSNFDKIDDYLTNRLPAEDRAAFEQSMAGDPSLRKEVAIQEKIIGSVQKARAAELKHMLQQVPVSSGGWSGGQIAASVIATGLVATGLYFYFQPEVTPTAPTEPHATEENISVPQPSASEPETEIETKTATVEEKKKPATKPQQTPTPVQKPDIKVADPTTELTDTDADQTPVTSGGPKELTVSKLQVVTEAANKKYTFHYQFAEGKLHLYGPFDRNLYEILEINGDSHAVFLFYKENYYLLDEDKTVITPLTTIRDGQLLKKLREYRSR